MSRYREHFSNFSRLVSKATECLSLSSFPVDAGRFRFEFAPHLSINGYLESAADERQEETGRAKDQRGSR